METISLSPAEIRKGDKIISSSSPKPRTVRTVEFCSSKPEQIHIDGECYDVRFATITKVV